MRRFQFVAPLAVLFALAQACSKPVADVATSTAPDLTIGTTTNPLTGTVSSLAGTCPAATFVIERKTIRVDAATTFGDARCTSLANGLRVEVVGGTQTDGSIVAASVRLLATTTTPPVTPTTVTITGTTRTVTGTCPNMAFVLEAKTIRTSSATVFSNGACADLRDSLRAEITGVVQSDGSVAASRVAIPVPTPPAPTTITVTGTIASIAGTCPAITLRVADRTALTSAATLFDGRGCDGLAVGISATVTGVVSTTSATIIASKVASPR